METERTEWRGYEDAESSSHAKGLQHRLEWKYNHEAMSNVLYGNTVEHTYTNLKGIACNTPKINDIIVLHVV